MAQNARLRKGPGFGILGVGMHLPDAIVGNSDIAKTSGVTAEWIAQKTGIEQRYVAADGETAADMATIALQAAARDARQRTGTDVAPEMLIVATSTPDRMVPAPAYDVHALAELPPIPTLSIDAACAGVAQGVITALGYFRSGVADTAMVVGTHRHEVYQDSSDRKTAALFGDGAGAYLLGPVPEGYGILSVRMLTDSSHRDAIRTDDVLAPNAGRKLSMNGRELVEVFANELPKMIYESLGEAGLTIADVDRLMLHQGNVRMVEAFTQLLGLDRSRVPITGNRVANTTAASLPITTVLTDRDRPLQRGDVIVLATAGAGVNGAVIVLRWY